MGVYPFFSQIFYPTENFLYTLDRLGLYRLAFMKRLSSNAWPKINDVIIIEKMELPIPVE